MRRATASRSFEAVINQAPEAWSAKMAPNSFLTLSAVVRPFSFLDFAVLDKATAEWNTKVNALKRFG